MFRIGPRGLTFIGKNKDLEKAWSELDSDKSLTLKEFCQAYKETPVEDDQKD